VRPEHETRVVVTGATGFIGTHLIRRLRREGTKVLAVVRTSPPDRSRHPGVEYALRDLERTDSLRDLLRAGDVIVHLAARVHMMRDTRSGSEDAYRRANVESTRMICRSAVESAARRMVYLSSAKVFGEGRERPYERTDPPAPADHYADSKLEAERAVREITEGGGVEWTIFRPPFVYGGGGKGNFPRLVALARLSSRVPLPLASVSNRRSILYVGNLVDALVRCGLHADGGGKVLLPRDARDVSTPELLDAIARVGSRRARLFRCPPRLLRAVARVVGRAGEMERLTESLRLDSRHLLEELQWEPPFTLDRALQRSVDPAHLTAKGIDDE
jgi:nucleoside-diphosphate-sugar epimerase